MDQDKSRTSDSAAASLESVWQSAASDLQLLVMLDVVHDWDRGDAISVGSSAAQAETLARDLVPTQFSSEGADVARVLRTLEGVVLRAERLARLAPAQARDDASGGAIAMALRRLAAASDELRERVEAASVLPPGAESGPDAA